MNSLRQLETVILLLMAVLAFGRAQACHSLSHPAGDRGFGAGLYPRPADDRLDPDLVFLVFLTPILWAAAYFTSWRNFRANLRPITLHSVGLMLVTTAAFVVVAHAALPGLGWAEAIARGAIVSPPDAVSATALARLDEMASEDWPVPEHMERMRVHYGGRLQRYAQAGAIDAECTPEAAKAFRRLRHEILTAERLALIGLRNDGAISDEVLHRLEHELDVEALQAGVGELRVSSEEKRYRRNR